MDRSSFASLWGVMTYNGLFKLEKTCSLRCFYQESIGFSLIFGKFLHYHETYSRTLPAIPIKKILSLHQAGFVRTRDLVIHRRIGIPNRTITIERATIFKLAAHKAHPEKAKAPRPKATFVKVVFPSLIINFK